MVFFLPSQIGCGSYDGHLLTVVGIMMKVVLIVVVVTAVVVTGVRPGIGMSQ